MLCSQPALSKQPRCPPFKSPPEVLTLSRSGANITWMGFGSDLKASRLPSRTRCPDQSRALSTLMGPIVQMPTEPLVPGQDAGA